MKKEDISYILTKNGVPTNVITEAMPLAYIAISKIERRFINPNLRLEFDMENEILICYTCKEYKGDIPKVWVKRNSNSNFDSHVNYDIVKNRTYKYLCDENLIPIVDIFDFDSINVISTSREA